MAEEKKDEQDKSGYVGVSPEYQNYADVRQKPFQATGDSKEAKAERALAKEGKAWESSGLTDQQLRAAASSPGNLANGRR